MIENTSYRVSWTTTAGASGSRVFPDWDPAVELYQDLAADRRVAKANLVEVTEREVRCFEHEPHERRAVPG